jgi:hypothetical protein
MSGIVLPGQEERPQQGGGIELPKGYASTREREAQAAQSEAPAASEEQTVAAAQSEQPTGPRGEPRFLFEPQVVQVQCPACGTPYAVPVFSIIDLGVNPELRGALLGGQANVARCPSCGAGGPLNAPLMVHDPEHEFLGVFIPPEAVAAGAGSSGILTPGGGAQEVQRQKIIGDLTQTLMRKLPQESRRGYLLQAKEYADWDRLMEVLWGFEGVTPEMLRRQRDQSALLQRLMTLANDPGALDIALERDKGLIDQDFFVMLDQVLGMVQAQGQAEAMAPLLQLRDKLLETTDAGAEIKAREDHIRSLLGRITRETTRDEIIDLLLEAWQEEDGRDVVGSLAVALSPIFDYQFLMDVTQRMEATEDEETRARLEELRTLVLQVQDRQKQSQAEQSQQAQAVLQEVLQATDVKSKLREMAAYIDEGFLALLAAQVQAAEQNGATGAARRMREIYDQALDLLQETLPPDLRLLNELLSAPDDAAVRTLLRENRELLTPELLSSLQPLEEEMRANGRPEMADRLKTLRGQVALMM